MHDEYGYIISIDNNIVWILGAKYFTLVEGVIRKDSEAQIGEKVYFGPGTRDKVFTLRRTIDVKETENVKENIQMAIKIAIDDNESNYINLINKAGPISINRHTLDLIDGIGEKYFKIVMDQRKIKPFENYDDFYNRVGIDLIKLIFKRINYELNENLKVTLFVKKAD